MREEREISGFLGFASWWSYSEAKKEVGGRERGATAAAAVAGVSLIIRPQVTQKILITDFYGGRENRGFAPSSWIV